MMKLKYILILAAALAGAVAVQALADAAPSGHASHARITVVQVARSQEPLSSVPPLSADEYFSALSQPVPAGPSMVPSAWSRTQAWRHYLALLTLYNKGMRVATPPSLRKIAGSGAASTSSTRTLLLQILQEQRHTDLVDSEIAMLLIRQEMGPQLKQARARALSTSRASR